ncbi:MAG TPA: NADH-quinone oxidoreductase subunit NuoK [Polyangiaceae bacterium]
MTLPPYLLLGAALFCIGVYGAMTRRSAIGVLLSVEVMANAVNVNLASFARYSGNIHTQLFAVFIMALTVAEVAVGLALVILLYRVMSHTNIDEARHLRH